MISNRYRIYKYIEQVPSPRPDTTHFLICFPFSVGFNWKIKAYFAPGSHEISGETINNKAILHYFFKDKNQNTLSDAKVEYSMYFQYPAILEYNIKYFKGNIDNLLISSSDYQYSQGIYGQKLVPIIVKGPENKSVKIENDIAFIDYFGNGANLILIYNNNKILRIFEKRRDERYLRGGGLGGTIIDYIHDYVTRENAYFKGAYYKMHFYRILTELFHPKIKIENEYFNIDKDQFNYLNQIYHFKNFIFYNKNTNKCEVTINCYDDQNKIIGTKTQPLAENTNYNKIEIKLSIKGQLKNCLIECGFDFDDTIPENKEIDPYYYFT